MRLDRAKLVVADADFRVRVQVLLGKHVLITSLLVFLSCLAIFQINLSTKCKAFLPECSEATTTLINREGFMIPNSSTSPRILFNRVSTTTSHTFVPRKTNTMVTAESKLHVTPSEQPSMAASLMILVEDNFVRGRFYLRVTPGTAKQTVA